MENQEMRLASCRSSILRILYPMENENRIDLSLFDGNSINEWRQKGAGGNQVYTIHTEEDDEKIVAEVYPHDDKFTHLINADLLHHAPELVAELRHMYEREDKLLGWIKRTITEAKDYVIYDEDDEMWTYNEVKNSNPALDAMDFVIDLATTDLKSV